eukprot:5055218-Prymnesium_polylepis.1
MTTGVPPPSVAHACVNAWRACGRKSCRATTPVRSKLLASASRAVSRTTGPSGGCPGAASW